MKDNKALWEQQYIRVHYTIRKGVNIWAEWEVKYFQLSLLTDPLKKLAFNVFELIFT